MPDDSKGNSEGNPDSFANQAQQKSPGLLTEFWYFLMQNKSWWLVPILAVLLLIGVLIALSSGSAVAPFIYTLF